MGKLSRKLSSHNVRTLSKLTRVVANDLPTPPCHSPGDSCSLTKGLAISSKDGCSCEEIDCGRCGFEECGCESCGCVAAGWHENGQDEYGVNDYGSDTDDELEEANACDDAIKILEGDW